MRLIWAAGIWPTLSETPGSDGSGRIRLETRSPDSELLSFAWASVVIGRLDDGVAGWRRDGLSMKNAEHCNSENNIARTQRRS
jgi:hypothetical protein